MALVLVGCDRRHSTAPTGFTARVRFTSEAVYLNQFLSVNFSAPIDALSITPDTIRVVDRQGHAVTSLRREVGSQVVRVHPRPPIEPGLHDGSFAPGQEYWIEIAGYPHINAVRAKNGNILAYSVRVPFRTVGLAGTAEIPRPLLGVATGGEPFALDPTRRLEVQMESSVLRVHFTLPPYPPSVRPQSFVVQRLAGGLQRLDVVAASVVREGEPLRGDIVELQLRADPPIGRNDYLALVLADGPDAVVDYSGRSIGGSLGIDTGPWQVFVRPGGLREIGRVSANDGPALDSIDLTTPSLEAKERARFVPRVRLAAGSGVHGELRPTVSAPLGPSEALKLSGGRVVRADATLELAGIDIPLGVRLTLRGFVEPVRILVTGSVRIAGELLLETPRGPVQFDDPMAQIRDDSLDGLAGCVMVAAGDIEVSGRIEHVQENAAMGPALALVAAGRLSITGRIPAGTVCATEGEFTGTAQRALVRPLRLRSGYAGLTSTVASAYTPWLLVPSWVQASVIARAIDAEPGVEVLWQTAPPNPIDGSVPDRRRDTWSTPRSLTEPLLGSAGSFVRFLLRVPVQPGRGPLAGIGGVSLHER